MSWAKVKKINSDMTTPIDVLLKNSTYLAATNETTLLPIIQTAYTVPANETQIGKEFRTNMIGYIRIYFSAEALSNYKLDFSLVIIRNGFRETYRVTGKLLGEREDVWLDIFVNKGDVISLSIFETKTYSQTIYKCSINGSIVFSPIGEPIQLTK